MDKLASPWLETRDQWVCGLLFWSVCVLAWLIFVPALHGMFIFDDFPNLDGLTQVSREPSLYSALQYIGHGGSGPLGRPIALATFALQHASWPRHPEDFIRVNVLLHLLNGCLLWWLLLRYQSLAHPQGGRAYALLALAATALWLLTPMQANAVFYTVQRMTVLSGTFILLGLLLHTVGRDPARRHRPLQAYLLMTAGVGVGLGLGILTKESAALYPALVLVYEATLLRCVARPARWSEWSLAFLKMPTLLILAYLAWIAFTIDSPGLPRPASWERLLFECRILFAYLYKLIVPTLYGTRLMYDDYPATLLATQWLTPVAAACWLAVALLAVRKRVVWPTFSFAVLWFLAAHLLESTVIPLELAFEHRNYLAAIGPLTLLAAGAAWLMRQPWAERVRLAILAAAWSYALFITMAMWQTAMLWGSPTELALFWSNRQPESRRALQHAGNSLFMIGASQGGREKFEEGMTRWPHDPTLPLALMQHACAQPDMALPAIDDIETRLRTSDGHPVTTVHMLDGLIRMVEDGACKQVRGADLQTLTRAALESSAFAGLQRFTLMLSSRSAELAGDRAAATRFLDDAIQLSPRISLLRQGIMWSLEAGDVAQARAYLATAETSAAVGRMERWSHRDEIAGMRQLIDLYESVVNHVPEAG